MPMGVYPRPTERVRFDKKFTKLDNGCWEWFAAKNHKGYGLFRRGCRMRSAHIVSYEWANGPVPEGLEIDHLCRNRSCVNPDHLEAVTRHENILRGKTGIKSGQKQKAKTHCPHGHPYDLLNTYITSNGGRACKICQKLSSERGNMSKEDKNVCPLSYPKRVICSNQDCSECDIYKRFDLIVPQEYKTKEDKDEN